MSGLRACGPQRFRPEIVAAFFLLLTALADADDDAYRRGQAAGRVVLTLRSPYACAIALLNDRCRADMTAYFADKTDADFKEIPRIGPHPLTGLEQFISDGDPAGLDPALASINPSISTPGDWARSAPGAALFDAGSESVLWPATLGSAAAEDVWIAPMIDLERHRSSIPRGTLPPAFDQLSPPGSGNAKGMGAMRGVTAAVVFELNQTRPPRPILAFVPHAGIRGDALDGVAFSTLAELIDNPAWLAQADAQLFANALMNDLPPQTPQLSAQTEACRKAVTSTISFDHDAAIRACVASTTAYLRSLPEGRKRAFYLGTAAAQTAYNGSVLRSTSSASQYLHIIASFSDLDAAVPAFAIDRVRAAGLAANDWQGQFSLGLRLVHELVPV